MANILSKLLRRGASKAEAEAIDDLVRMNPSLLETAEKAVADIDDIAAASVRQSPLKGVNQVAGKSAQESAETLRTAYEPNFEMVGQPKTVGSLPPAVRASSDVVDPALKRIEPEILDTTRSPNVPSIRGSRDVVSQVPEQVIDASETVINRKSLPSWIKRGAAITGAAGLGAALLSGENDSQINDESPIAQPSPKELAAMQIQNPENDPSAPTTSLEQTAQNVKENIVRKPDKPEESKIGAETKTATLDELIKNPEVLKMLKIEGKTAGTVDALKDAQRRRDEDVFLNQAIKAGLQIGSGISGAKMPDTSILDQNVERANRYISDLKATMEQEKTDPSSPTSKAFAQFAKQFGYDLQGFSAADAEKFLPTMYKEFEAKRTGELDKQKALLAAQQKRDLLSEEQKFIRSEREASEKFKAGEAEKTRKADLDKARLALAAKTAQEKATPFDKKVQEEQAKAYVEWRTKDRDQMASNLHEVKNALSIMDKYSDKKDLGWSAISGPIKGLAPDSLRAFTHPDALAAKQSMRKAILETLRPTLGAQFTENEGERIQNLAFDESQPPQENRRRAKVLDSILDWKLRYGDALNDHLRKYGNDKDFPYGEWNAKKETIMSQIPSTVGDNVVREQQPDSAQAQYPKQVRRGTQTATVSNPQEEMEARQEGWR